VQQRAAEEGSLWSNRNFNVYWAGQTLSALGDAFAFVAVPLLVLDATGSVGQMGLVTATFGLGQIMSGPFAGALVDRVDRRRLMIVCDIGRAFLYALIPFVWFFFGPSLGLIYFVTAVGSMLGNVFGVAYITATVNLVDPHHLVAANGRLQGSHGFTFVLGPMLAGFVTARFGGAAAIGLDALSFVISAISLSMIRLRKERAEKTTHESPMEELLAGVRHLFGEPVLRAVAIFFIVLTMLLTGVLDLMIYEVKHQLSRDDSTVGLVMGAGAIGAAIGGLIANRARGRFGFGACFLGATFVQAIAICAMGLWANLTVIVLTGMLFSGGMVVRGVVTMSLRQQITPDELLGRVTAAFWTLAAVLGPLGAALATRIAESIGPEPVLVAIGAVSFLCGLWAMTTPVRQARPEATALRAPRKAA
jgi:MFS family permease